MKNGKLKLGDIFINKYSDYTSDLRIGIVSEIRMDGEENVCRVQCDPTTCLWITSKGLKEDPLYEYVGHVDLDELYNTILAPYKEKDTAPAP